MHLYFSSLRQLCYYKMIQNICANKIEIKESKGRACLRLNIINLTFNIISMYGTSGSS